MNMRLDDLRDKANATFGIFFLAADIACNAMPCPFHPTNHGLVYLSLRVDILYLYRFRIYARQGQRHSIYPRAHRCVVDPNFGLALVLLLLPPVLVFSGSLSVSPFLSLSYSKRAIVITGLALACFYCYFVPCSPLFFFYPSLPSPPSGSTGHGPSSPLLVEPLWVSCQSSNPTRGAQETRTASVGMAGPR